MNFDTKVLAERRQNLFHRIGDGAVLIVRAGRLKTRSADTDYRFRTHSDMVWLTGFEEPDAILVLAPGASGEDVGAFNLFVRPRNPEREQWDGLRAGVEGAIADYGADRAFPLDQFETELPRILEGAHTLHVELGTDPTFDATLTRTINGLRRRRGKPPANPSSLRDSRDVLHAMRLVKTPDELVWIRRACEISAEAHTAAMKACRPGMHEYELQALIEYIFTRRGAAAPAYTTIVGAGQNATILHYIENRSVIGDGEIVLIDAGCEYNFYAGDISRSFPASGKFTPAQRDVYQAVLDAETAAIAMCTSQYTSEEIHNATVRNLTTSLVDIGLLAGAVDELIETDAYKKYYMHKTGHWLGVDVHDPCPYYEGNAATKIVDGSVQTIEPGIYVPRDDEGAPPDLRGVGIRIEDDVLATSRGPVVLTCDAPKTIEAIESIVGSGYTIEA